MQGRGLVLPALFLLWTRVARLWEAPCWKDGSSKFDCCESRYPLNVSLRRRCFDVIFTRRECCHLGKAMVFPEAELSQTMLRDDATEHPSTSVQQRMWEAQHEHVSIRNVLKIQGQRITLRDFKDNQQFKRNYDMYRTGGDPYDIVENPMPSGAVALDVGANLGLVSILLALHGHGDTNVYALEPHPVRFRYLLWNLRENNVTSHVWPLNLGGCNPGNSPARIQILPLALPEEFQGASRNLAHEMQHVGNMQLHVPCTSLEQLFAQMHLRRLELLKVACDGCEYGFLMAGDFLSSVLKSQRITRFVGELGHPLPREAASSDYINEIQWPHSSIAQELFGSFCRNPEDYHHKVVIKGPGCQSLLRGLRREVHRRVSAFLRTLDIVRFNLALEALHRWPYLEPWGRSSTSQPWPSFAEHSWKISSKINAAIYLRRLKPFAQLLCARLSAAVLREALPTCQSTAPCVAEFASRINELLRRGNDIKGADAFFETIKENTAWLSSWHTPRLFVQGLTSRPVWRKSDLDALAPGRGVKLLSRRLQDGFSRILEDLQRILSRPWPPSYGPELIHNPWNWTKVTLYDGDLAPRGHTFEGEPYQSRQLHAGLCAKYAPNTCDLLKDAVPGIRDPSLAYLQPDHEQVNFFRLSPGSQIQFHQAGQNARLTVHICLTGCGGSSYLQVGPHRLRWLQGRVMVFDDSFIHRVSIDPTLPEDRWILHVMVVHPDVEDSQSLKQALDQGRLWPS